MTDAIPERHPDNGSPALLAEFDTRNKPEDLGTIRVIVRDKQGHEAEARVQDHARGGRCSGKGSAAVVQRSGE